MSEAHTNVEIHDASDISAVQDALLELKCRGLKLSIVIVAVGDP
jgi:hypothetical protein